MQNSKQKQYNNPVRAIVTGLTDLFRKQKPSAFLTDDMRLVGKTVLIDGASSGLGFAVAVETARRGARVIMACRGGIPHKGEEVKKLSGSDSVFMEHVNFSEIASIQQLVESLKKYGPIDIYICNAGIVPKQSRKTADGFEEMFMVNYLSKFIMIRLLLKENLFSLSSVARIIIVASESHRNPKEIEWENFGKYEEFSIGKSVERYGYFKLLLTTFSSELSRRLNRDGHRYSVLTLCPGPINSNIAREAPALFQPLLKLVFAIFFRSPSKAARPVIYFAAADEPGKQDYQYFFLMTERAIDEKAASSENGKKLWEKSEEIIKTRHIVL